MLPLADHRAARLAALQAPDGWLNLIARIDLDPGLHRLGTAEAVQLPSGPPFLGTLALGTDGTATFARPGEDPRPFLPAAGGFPQLRAEPFLLEVHTVAGKPALRIRDLRLHPSVTLRYYPEAPQWVIRAAWENLPQGNLRIALKDGSFATVSVTHQARFTHDGREVTLTATHWKGDQPMFVFRDRTAGETYPACRFLHGEDIEPGAITLDFNRAFTPPCGFTPYAICPLPPPGNVLPFRIEAGELAP